MTIDVFLVSCITLLFLLALSEKNDSRDKI